MSVKVLKSVICDFSLFTRSDPGVVFGLVFMLLRVILDARH